MKKRSACYFVVVFFSVFLCCCKRDQQVALNLPANVDSTYPYVFIPKPGVSYQQVISALTNLGYIKNADLSITRFCASCDSTIFTLPATAITGSATQGLAPGTENPPTGHPSGEGSLSALVNWTYNFTINSPEPLDTNPRTFRANPDSPANWTTVTPVPVQKTDTVKIGVLDTGVDPDIANRYIGEGFSTCIPGNEGKAGWNFSVDDIADQNSDFRDDLPSKHGTPIVKFMAQQVENEVVPQILPVKVLNKFGHCTLFQVMCGLAYAEKAGVKIINASLGFYAQPWQVAAFKDYIKTITDKGIIIVAAAGNQNEKADQDFIGSEKITDADLVKCRNLDLHPFYPAAFSDSNMNIISVTTISKKESNTAVVCPGQNFSGSRVQVGVHADYETYFFAEPETLSKGLYTTRFGSSFAAPIVTGQIAGRLHQFFPNDNPVLNSKEMNLNQSPVPGTKNVYREEFLAAVFSVTPAPVSQDNSSEGVSAPFKIPLYKTFHKWYIGN